MNAENETPFDKFGWRAALKVKKHLTEEQVVWMAKVLNLIADILDRRIAHKKAVRFGSVYFGDKTWLNHIYSNNASFTQQTHRIFSTQFIPYFRTKMILSTKFFFLSSPEAFIENRMAFGGLQWHNNILPHSFWGKLLSPKTIKSDSIYRTYIPSKMTHTHRKKRKKKHLGDLNSFSYFTKRVHTSA